LREEIKVFLLFYLKLILLTFCLLGGLYLWDYKTGYRFQDIKSQIQPGSISAEGGVFAAAFDQSSLRLITGECDKTIKIWKEDETANPETHPVENVKMEFENMRF